MSAMPVMIVVLCLGAIAYRYYSAFLAARVLALDPNVATPAHRFDDGQNFHPTSKWVLFGHHFAAISGAGPLIGPVLAAQFGYLPGLIWIVIGVCLAGAVQDFLVLAMSARHDGRSLAQIAYAELNRVAGAAATIAILFIVIVAIAGLGKVVVKALGGEVVQRPTTSSTLVVALDLQTKDNGDGTITATFGEVSYIQKAGQKAERVPSPYSVRLPAASAPQRDLGIVVNGQRVISGLGLMWRYPSAANETINVPGSSWGVFTIACTIPIALLVGLWMYRIRPGKVVEASILGGVLTLVATVAGGWISRSSFAHVFELSANGVTWSMAAYGFVAAVLPVWVLLVPRDYLSSFLKIGTIAVLVVGTLIANPKLQTPPLNPTFFSNGPIVKGTIFPFLFITVMCGAISGFHALISSGTTSKMLKNEGDARTIGYGAMLIEGLVAVVAMIAAASLPVRDYYAMNTALADAPAFNDRILSVAGAGGPEHIAQYESYTEETLRGRTGGAVTLAVGMANIFDHAFRSFASGEWLRAMWRYWYHFAIMFEALFILTTIDAGTRVGRFLLQEVLGRAHPKLGLNGGAISAVISTALIVGAWVWMLGSGSFSLIWAIFGVANQSLAVIALAIVSAWLVNAGKSRYVWVTVVPMLVVYMTTTSAAVALLGGQVDGITTQIRNDGFHLSNAKLLNPLIQSSLIVAMMVCTVIVAGSALVAALWGPKRERDAVGATVAGAVD